MFIFVATALAGTALGWPCQRLNWAWRNVWTTCSINSYTPVNLDETATSIPTGFRTRASAFGPNTPTAALAPNGIFTPIGTGGGVPEKSVPNLLCQFGPNTGSGYTATLRNRCRRAIDSYGGLVKMCGAPQGLYPNRGPVNGLAAPDWAPATGHQPHVTNVQGLTHNAQMCLLPTGQYTPSGLNSPQTTCPGLLGWFTVVFNACGFSTAPGMSPANLPNAGSIGGAPYVANYFPVGSTANAVALGFTGPVGVGVGAGFFCAGTPIATTWNLAGATFRTSRCRKALDQFGRTAARCHASSNAIAAGPAQAGGYSDPLRLLAVGTAGAGSVVVPMGFNSWTPACN
jgi:hypothetical protein